MMGITESVSGHRRLEVSSIGVVDGATFQVGQDTNLGVGLGTSFGMDNQVSQRGRADLVNPGDSITLVVSS